MRYIELGILCTSSVPFDDVKWTLYDGGCSAIEAIVHIKGGWVNEKKSNKKFWVNKKKSEGLNVKIFILNKYITRCINDTIIYINEWYYLPPRRPKRTNDN